MSELPVTLTFGNTEHRGFGGVQVYRSIYTISGTFDLTLSPVWEKMPETFFVAQGERCTLKLGSSTVITGFIDTIQFKLQSTKRWIQVLGRDQTADLVDCSSLRVSRTWQNVSLEMLLKDLLSPFHIPFKILDSTPHLFPVWSIQEESVFDNLSRAASMKGLLLLSHGNGEVVICPPKSGKPKTHLHEKGIVAIERICDEKNRFSFYGSLVPQYGLTGGDTKKLKMIAQAWDREVKRPRPLLISQDGEIRADVAQKRLNWEKRIRRAKSERIILTVLGWTESSGQLWRINEVVSLVVPSLGINGTYLFVGVRFELDSSGQKTRLECEGVHSADIDPTLEAKVINEKKLVESDIFESKRNLPAPWKP